MRESRPETSPRPAERQRQDKLKGGDSPSRRLRSGEPRPLTSKEEKRLAALGLGKKEEAATLKSSDGKSHPAAPRGTGQPEPDAGIAAAATGKKVRNPDGAKGSPPIQGGDSPSRRLRSGEPRPLTSKEEKRLAALGLGNKEEAATLKSSDGKSHPAAPRGTGQPEPDAGIAAAATGKKVRDPDGANGSPAARQARGAGGEQPGGGATGPVHTIPEVVIVGRPDYAGHGRGGGAEIFDSGGRGSFGRKFQALEARAKEQNAKARDSPSIEEHAYAKNVVITCGGEEGRWAANYVKGNPEGRGLVKLDGQPTREAIVKAYQQAARAAGRDGVVVVSVGHGGSAARPMPNGERGGINEGLANRTAERIANPKDGWLELAPNGRFRLGGLNVTNSHVNVFRTGEAAKRHSADWQVYQDIGRSLHEAGVRKVVLLTCNVGKSEEFVKRISIDWGIVVEAYTRRVAFVADNGRVRCYLEGDRPGVGTNIRRNESEIPLPDEQNSYRAGPPLPPRGEPRPLRR